MYSVCPISRNGFVCSYLGAKSEIGLLGRKELGVGLRPPDEGMFMGE
jgi:hypothetical protein